MGSRFYDSDVILGIVLGEPRFQSLTLGEMATSRLNLMEVYYVLKRGKRQEAPETFQRCLPNTIGFTDDDIMAAMDWRSEHFQKRVREFSYVDALGYQVARSNGLTFTTGDRRFSGYPGVEIVR